MVKEFKYFWREYPRKRWALFIVFAVGAFIHALYIIYEYLFRSRR